MVLEEEKAAKVAVDMAPKVVEAPVEAKLQVENVDSVSESLSR